MTEISIRSKLAALQKSLKAPKDQNNSFGGFKYRNAESILDAVKSYSDELCITLTDELVMIGDRFYIKSTATISDSANNRVECVAYAREALTKKGMDESQVTGSASSYARKYALCGLLAISDPKDDPDSKDHTKQEPDQTQTKKLLKVVLEQKLETLKLGEDYPKELDDESYKLLRQLNPQYLREKWTPEKLQKYIIKLDKDLKGD